MGMCWLEQPVRKTHRCSYFNSNNNDDDDDDNDNDDDDDKNTYKIQEYSHICTS
jgi:hypothetical protein